MQVANCRLDASCKLQTCCKLRTADLMQVAICRLDASCELQACCKLRTADLLQVANYTGLLQVANYAGLLQVANYACLLQVANCRLAASCRDNLEHINSVATDKIIKNRQDHQTKQGINELLYFICLYVQYICHLLCKHLKWH